MAGCYGNNPEDRAREAELHRYLATLEEPEPAALIPETLICIQVDDINTSDYPDLCDAFISYAEHADGTPLTENELDYLNENHGEFVHTQALERL
jgi:hypothetical protein